MEESILREELAFSYRELARMNLHEGVCNHLTIALSGNDSFLVIRYGCHWAQCTPSDLLLVDASGTVLKGEGTAEITAVCIHAAIHTCVGYERAPVVFHTHMPAATAMSCLVTTEGYSHGTLLPIHQNACRFIPVTAYDNMFNGLGNSSIEGERIASALAQGSARVLFMANHGIIVIGASAAECLDDLYYLERTCANQVMCMSAVGGNLDRLKLIDEDVMKRTHSALEKDRVAYAQTHFRALRSMESR
jgi:ribulose-5-phosphate 4-epimerase/fuculose-1-phosphate aldolase